VPDAAGTAVPERPAGAFFAGMTHLSRGRAAA